MPISRDAIIQIGLCACTCHDADRELSKQSERRCVRSFCIKGAMEQMSLFLRSIWKLGSDDHRRVIHALKVGFALSLVCLLTILEPTYKQMGKNTIWAVMTVIVIFEFTAGATLCKGLNRGFGTLLAALLALGISHLSVLGGELVEAMVVGVSIFVVGAVATFARFIPKIKAKFDYGVMIFLLTFSLILVMAYQDIDSMHTSMDRLFTICIGCAIALIVSILVCPIWAGEDLHMLIVNNLDKLSLSLQECVNQYVSDDCLKELQLSKLVSKGKYGGDPIYNHYRGALLSSATEESLANFASWEPPHGQFKVRHPWKKYLKVGVAMRHCAYGIVALHSCLHSDTQAPFALRKAFKEELLHVATEAASVLHELSVTVRTMKTRSNARNSLDSAVKASRNLNKALSRRTGLFFTCAPCSQQQALQDATPASCAETIATSHPQKEAEEAISTENYATANNAACRSSSKPPMHHRVFSSPLPNCGGGRASASIPGCATFEGEASSSLLSLASFASLLVEVVARLGLVAEAVDDLAKAAHFKEEQAFRVEAETEAQASKPHGKISG